MDYLFNFNGLCVYVCAVMIAILLCVTYQIFMVTIVWYYYYIVDDFFFTENGGYVEQISG